MNILWKTGVAYGPTRIPYFGRYHPRPLGLMAKFIRTRALGFHDGGPKIMGVVERFMQGLRDRILPWGTDFQAGLQSHVSLGHKCCPKSGACPHCGQVLAGR
ncbi:MAG: hypothetical protein ACREJN_03785 [Nitrospiraceae bacterium]